LVDILITEPERVHALENDGYSPELVKELMNKVRLAEYKRRQAPPGVRITQRGFGKDRRYPITSGYQRFFND